MESPQGHCCPWLLWLKQHPQSATLSCLFFMYCLPAQQDAALSVPHCIKLNQQMTRKMLCLARLQSWFFTFLLRRQRKERRGGGREALPVQTPQTSPQPRKNKPDFRGCPLPLAPAQGCRDNPCFAAGMEQMDSLSALCI